MPAGFWGTQRAAPGHSYCQGTAEQSPGLPRARCRVADSRGLLAGRGHCYFPGFSLFFPALLHHGTQQSQVWSGSVLTPSTRSPCSLGLTQPHRHRAAVLGVAATTARVITSWKHVSPRVCLLIPAGCVLVCVYDQQIPPTTRSLSENSPVLAGLALCSVLSPCAPALFPC